MPGQRTAPAADERQVKVDKGSNAIFAKASGHTWIALAGSKGELVRDQSGAPETSFGAQAGTYSVRTDGKLKGVEARMVELPQAPGMSADAASLRLTSDAKDVHPADGVGEIAADGASSATVTVQKIGADGEPLARRTDTDEVFLRTTGGALQDETGKAIRSVKLASGTATFRIVSEAAGRLVTIEAFGNAPLGGGELRIEFV